MKELMQELVDAMVASATDELGNGYPDWWMDEWDDQVNGLTILTERSRDPRRSRNGGEYDFYLHVDLRPDGADIWEGSSCELISSAESKARSTRMFAISLSPEGLERMAKLAEARALIQIAPEETLDPKMIAVIEAACALWGNPKQGIGVLKDAVRNYEASIKTVLIESEGEPEEVPLSVFLAVDPDTL